MMTSVAEKTQVVRAKRDLRIAKADLAVPRHLAIVLNNADTGALDHDAASSALEAMLSGCTENGIAVLTLIRPPAHAQIFESALKSVRANMDCDRDLRINLASPRSGREEIVESVRALAARGDVKAINAEAIENNLSTRGLPPIDLLIAIGGGGMLSGALLWQSAYAELLFIDSDWQAFSGVDFDRALVDYSKRCRKFGGLA